MTTFRRSGLITVIAIAAAGLAVQVGCFGSSPPVSKIGPELVDGGVIFRYHDPNATTVHVVGDFNNWSPRADPMIDKNGDGEWTLLYTLPPGRYQYKFVINGVKWIPDPRNGNSVPDGFDGVNSVLRIPATAR